MYKKIAGNLRLAGKGVRSGVNAGNRPHSADKDVICMGGVQNYVLTSLVPAAHGSDRYSICAIFVICHI